MAKTAASDKNMSAPAKKAQRSKISVTLGRKRGKKGGKSAADDGESEEQMFEPMPDHYPGVSTKPVTGLTAASPFWELEDMQPESEGADKADNSIATAAEDASAMNIDDDDSISELDFGSSKNKGASASKHKKATDAAPKLKIGGRLRPGQALQRCSGADVMLSKSAMNRPNLAKSKGRYLIVLPGGLYPRVPGAEERERLVGAQKADAGSDGAAGSVDMKAEDTTTDPEEKEKDGGVDDDLKIIDNGADASGKDVNPTDATTTPNKPAPFTPSTAPSVLGQLQKLGTDSPILRIPFPDGRVMLLKGRKISLTTSYMALTCKSTGRGGQGTVTCKDIFAGAIVFGDVGWEDNGATADAAAAPTTAENRLIQHFGPSERTVDGGRAVKGGTSRYSASVKRGTSNLSRRSASSPMQLSDRDGDDDEDDLGSDPSSILHDVDTDEDEAFVGRASDSPVVKRQASSRRSGARVNYADMIKDSDVEEDDEDGSDENADENDDSSVEEVIPAKKKRTPPKEAATPKPAQRPKAASTKKAPAATTSSTRKKTPPAKKTPKETDSESDYDGGDDNDDDVVAVDEISSTSKTPSSTGRQRKEISYAENSDGSGVDDDEAFSEEEKKAPSAKKKAVAKTPTSGKRGGTSAKKAAAPTSSKKKAAVKISKPKSEPIEINDDDSEEKKVDDLAPSSAAKAAPRSPEPTSAVRRRKKKTSPKKSPAGGGSAKKRRLDLMDDDDEFAFLG